jgi:hypothetical protein
MAPKRKVLAASCVMLFIGHLLAAFHCCGLLFQCCGLLLALRNAFLDIVQHNSFSTSSADQEHLFCLVFDVDEDAPEFCFLFAVFAICYRNYIIRSVLVQRQSFVLCLCFLICKLLIHFIFWCRLKYSPGWYVHMYNLATPSLFV